LNIILSTDYDHVFAKEFEVLVDPNPASGAAPAIALMVTPIHGDPFIVPMLYEAAMYIAKDIMVTLSHEAPHLLLQ
jgi:hypothetical protein